MSDRPSGTSTIPESVAPAPRLALRPREAAQALGISERLLWRLTNQGDIPHLRLGLRVVYPVDALQKWLADHPQKKGGGP